MIDDKKIEAAAKHYAEENSMSIEDQMGDVYDGIEELSDAYKAGAKWAQEELLESLWHPASEKPSAGKPLIVEYSITDTIKDYASLKRLNNSYIYWDWVSYFESANITRWLYIDDLLPKEGGNQ